MALVGWVKIHRIAGCISSGSWLLAAASRRAPDSRGLLGGSNTRAVGNQNWGVSCRRWDDLPADAPSLVELLLGRPAVCQGADGHASAENLEKCNC